MKFVYTTYPSKKVSDKIALETIEKKLAVCVDSWKISSQFPWREKIEKVDQYMTLFTTDGERLRALKEYIATTHPYEVPLIAESDIHINEKYRHWAEDTFHDREQHLTQ